MEKQTYQEVVDAIHGHTIVWPKFGELFAHYPKEVNPNYRKAIKAADDFIEEWDSPSPKSQRQGTNNIKI
jgi:hypothetical protein